MFDIFFFLGCQKCLKWFDVGQWICYVYDSMTYSRVLSYSRLSQGFFHYDFCGHVDVTELFWKSDNYYSGFSFSFVFPHRWLDVFEVFYDRTLRMPKNKIFFRFFFCVILACVYIFHIFLWMGVCQDVFETSKNIHSLTVDFSAFLSCFFCISISFHVLFLLVLCFQKYKCMPQKITRRLQDI